MSHRSHGRAALPVLVSLLAALAITLLALIGFRVGPWGGPPHGRDLLGSGKYEAMEGVDRILEETPEAERTDTLLALMKEGPDARYAAIEHLRGEPTRRAAPAVERAFLDPYSHVRLSALETLHLLDRDRGMALVVSALRDEDTQVREAAIIVARQMPDRRLVPALVMALDDPTRGVRVTAAGLLREIVGEGPEVKYTDPDEKAAEAFAYWKGWWKENETGWDLSLSPARIPGIAPMPDGEAPRFELAGLHGGRVGTKKLAGKAALVNFWAPWCEECVAEMPTLRRLHDEFRGRGLAVVGLVMSDETPDELRSWLAARKITYPQAVADERTAAAFGHVHEIPRTVLIGRDGRIRRVWDGARDYETFRAAVERALNE